MSYQVLMMIAECVCVSDKHDKAVDIAQTYSRLFSNTKLSLSLRTIQRTACQVSESFPHQKDGQCGRPEADMGSPGRTSTSQILHQSTHCLGTSTRLANASMAFALSAHTPRVESVSVSIMLVQVDVQNQVRARLVDT